MKTGLRNSQLSRREKDSHFFINNDCVHVSTLHTCLLAVVTFGNI